MDGMRLGKRAADGENGAEKNDDDQLPIRRSTRIADRDSAMKIRSTTISKSDTTVVPSDDGGRRGRARAPPPPSPLGKKRGLTESSSNGQTGTRNDKMNDEAVRSKKMKADTDAAAEKKKNEEAEEKRKKEMVEEIRKIKEEKEIKMKIDQAKFDEEGETLYNELKSVPRRLATSEEFRQQLDVLSQLIVRLNTGISQAVNGVGTAIMDFTLGDARQIKRRMEIQLEKMMKKEEDERREKESMERMRKFLEERDRLEKEEERKKKEEEEGKMKEDERNEKNRMEASMIDKECKICFDEIKMGVGCMLCMQVLGCKTCVDEWLKTDKSCPNCRRQYTNVSKQVKKVEQMNDPNTPKSSSKKTPITPSRRSSRGHAQS